VLVKDLSNVIKKNDKETPIDSYGLNLKTIKNQADQAKTPETPIIEIYL
jgi:hypothetical protein